MLANKIVSMFPEKIDRYIEVFGVGGSVLFAKEKHAPLEIYNDANGQLVNLFRCIRFHREELQREISGYVNAREDHERLCACLRSIKGRFVLSYNDDEYVRELYRDFNITAVSRQNNLSRGEYKELIITNY